MATKLPQSQMAAQVDLSLDLPGRQDPERAVLLYGHRINVVAQTAERQHFWDTTPSVSPLETPSDD